MNAPDRSNQSWPIMFQNQVLQLHAGVFVTLSRKKEPRQDRLSDLLAHGFLAYVCRKHSVLFAIKGGDQ